MSLKLPSSPMVPWCMFSSRLVHPFYQCLSISSCFSKDLVCSLPAILPSGCHELLFPVVTARLAVGNTCSQIRHLMANLEKEKSSASDCSDSSAQLKTSLCPFRKEAHVEEHREVFWGQERQLEAQFYWAFRDLLMPNFCCLCTSHLFSAQGRSGTCFFHERGVSVYCYCAQPPRFLLV